MVTNITNTNYYGETIAAMTLTSTVVGAIKTTSVTQKKLMPSFSIDCWLADWLAWLVGYHSYTDVYFLRIIHVPHGAISLKSWTPSKREGKKIETTTIVRKCGWKSERNEWTKYWRVHHIQLLHYLSVNECISECMRVSWWWFVCLFLTGNIVECRLSFIINLVYIKMIGQLNYDWGNHLYFDLLHLYHFFQRKTKGFFVDYFHIKNISVINIYKQLMWYLEKKIK